MAIYTSYFAFAQWVPSKHLISIAGRAPDGFSGTSYKKLAPKYTWWKKWKEENLSEEFYKQNYNESVLGALDPAQVLSEIGDDKILLCWEKPDKFCHRHLVAAWLGAGVKELDEHTRAAFLR
ncbi:MAG: hypothetical protein LBB23_02180 [Rickettsiales bacterium]|jgi:uncharacterized protein (DUF488 family)|nr:hypothetical protein [Rickettsiales bacterium]